MDYTKRYLAELNSQQLFAVTHTEGPMLILAGAGSGKTRTLTHKIAFLVDQTRCRPEQILAVTFTNKAASEMRERVETLLGLLPSAPLVSTFHSFCVRLLRRHAPLLDYRSDFTICDADDQKTVLRQVYKGLGLKTEDLALEKARSLISAQKNRKWGGAAHPNQDDPLVPLLSRIRSAYEASLRSSNALDFDDLLILAGRLLSEHEHLRIQYGEFFEYLLIDEYQDTNPAQYELVKLLTCRHQNITAVGDEDQSIYAFRGADINNILRFEEDFPGTRVVKLEQNYRSTQTILDAATAVVSNNVKRKDKVLWTERGSGEPVSLYVAHDAREEAEYVASATARQLELGGESMAVLYRTNFQSRQFEEALRKRGVRYKLVGGVSFYNRKEIKDALAYLRLIRNPADSISLARIINEPARGIGQTTLERVAEIARHHELSLWEAIGKGLEEGTLAARSHLALERFRGLIETCREFLSLPLASVLDRVLDESGYYASLKGEDTEEAQNRLLNLKELLTVAREYAGAPDPFQEFLDHAALRSEADDYDESAPVTLMTLHNAKGLEFSLVFLVGCEEGLFPHSRAVIENDELEEERRLCYVGLTRAQKKLYLTYSRRRRFFARDTQEQNQPSRFLSEIPGHLLTVEYSDPRWTQQARWPGPGMLGRQSLSTPRRGSSNFTGKTYNSVDSVRQYLQRGPGRSSESARQFVSGATVSHHEFGTGRILAVEPMGEDLKITVQFPGFGIKKLVQRYAKLKLV